jgi:hypothetical protein
MGSRHPVVPQDESHEFYEILLRRSTKLRYVATLPLGESSASAWALAGGNDKFGTYCCLACGISITINDKKENGSKHQFISEQHTPAFFHRHSQGVAKEWISPRLKYLWLYSRLMVSWCDAA